MELHSETEQLTLRASGRAGGMGGARGSGLEKVELLGGVSSTKVELLGGVSSTVSSTKVELLGGVSSHFKTSVKFAVQKSTRDVHAYMPIS